MRAGILTCHYTIAESHQCWNEKSDRIFVIDVVKAIRTRGCVTTEACNGQKSSASVKSPIIAWLSVVERIRPTRIHTKPQMADEKSIEALADGSHKLRTFDHSDANLSASDIFRVKTGSCLYRIVVTVECVPVRDPSERPS